MKSIYLIALLWLLPITIGHAQDERLKPIFTFTNGMPPAENWIDYSETEWQPDSESFNFRYAMAEKSLRLHYVTATNELTSIEARFPCALAFSQTQLKNFGASSCPQSLSPNGRYIVYPTEEIICDEQCSATAALGDLETGAHVVIKKDLDVGYIVRWSENSSAFLIMDYDPVGVLSEVWHVKVPRNLPAINEVAATRLANFIRGDIGYVDISPDGQQVLVRGNGNFTSGLTLWDSHFPSSVTYFAAWEDGRWLLQHKRVAGASFIPDDPHHILVVTDEGIVQFDLETETFTVLNTNINAKWTYWVYFSPDVKYALIYDDKPNGVAGQQITLFRLDLQNSASN